MSRTKRKRGKRWTIRRDRRQRGQYLCTRGTGREKKSKKFMEDKKRTKGTSVRSRKRTGGTSGRRTRRTREQKKWGMRSS